ncbi:MAG: hypothetical protein ABFD50_15415 [Smithella sp.]
MARLVILADGKKYVGVKATDATPEHVQDDINTIKRMLSEDKLSYVELSLHNGDTLILPREAAMRSHFIITTR